MERGGIAIPEKPIGCPICARGRAGRGRAYIHCPAYRALVHMSHCVQDGCPYHSDEISTDWCRYRTAKQKAGDTQCRTGY